MIMSSTWSSKRQRTRADKVFEIVVVILILGAVVLVPMFSGSAPTAEAVNEQESILRDRVVETLYQDELLVIEGEFFVITVDDFSYGGDWSRSPLALFQYLEQDMTFGFDEGHLDSAGCSSKPGEPVVFCHLEPEDISVFGFEGKS